MQPDLKVTKSIVVDVKPARAFAFFLDQERWWPIATHHMAEPPGETAVLEPFVGGRWYERASDGSETDWGAVLAFERMSADWTHEPDPDRASEIEVTFVPEGRERTRVVYEHRHLERYGEQAERMRTVLARPKAAEAVLRAYEAAITAAKKPQRKRKAA